MPVRRLPRLARADPSVASCSRPYARAEQAGFTAAMCSDHFSPWSERQGHSAFAWSWLGAALQATSLPFGVVNAPGQRYHPAIIAQAIATLGAMFPGRFWVALGHRRGVQRAHHRRAAGRARRSATPGCASAWTSSGPCSPARRSATTAWSPSTGPGSGPCPTSQPPLIGAAVSVETAGWVGELGRRAGHRSTSRADKLRQMIDAYRSTRVAADRWSAGPPLVRADAAEARAIAHDQWRTNVFAPPVCWDLDHAEAFDAASERRPARGRRRGRLRLRRPGRHAEHLHELADLGSTRSTCTTSARTRTAFIDASASDVLPQLDVTAKAERR